MTKIFSPQIVCTSLLAGSLIIGSACNTSLESNNMEDEENVNWNYDNVSLEDSIDGNRGSDDLDLEEEQNEKLNEGFYQYGDSVYGNSIYSTIGGSVLTASLYPQSVENCEAIEIKPDRDAFELFIVGNRKRIEFVFGPSFLSIDPYNTTSRHVIVGDIDGDYMRLVMILLSTGMLSHEGEILPLFIRALEDYETKLLKLGRGESGNYYDEIGRIMGEIVPALHESIINAIEEKPSKNNGITLSLLGDMLSDRYTPIWKERRDSRFVRELLTKVKTLYPEDLNLIIGNHDLCVCKGACVTKENLPSEDLEFLTKHCDFLKVIKVGNHEVILSHAPVSSTEDKISYLRTSVKENPTITFDALNGFLKLRIKEKVCEYGVLMTNTRHKNNAGWGSTKYSNLHGHDGAPFNGQELLKGIVQEGHYSPKSFDKFYKKMQRGCQLGLNSFFMTAKQQVEPAGPHRYSSICTLYKESGIGPEETTNINMSAEIRTKGF